MNHRIPCEIIQDLMPMYADGLTSETTDREIRSHLEECETCREMYERMKAEMEGDASQTLSFLGTCKFQEIPCVFQLLSLGSGGITQAVGYGGSAVSPDRFRALGKHGHIPFSDHLLVILHEGDKVPVSLQVHGPLL